MIFTRETARNGLAIYKLDGRSVVSSFDPMREARGWAQNALAQIGDRDTVIIVGAGCGYHIIALRELRPNLSILTIEQDQEISDFAREVLSSQSETDPVHFGAIITAKDAMALSDSLLLRDFMSQRFAVVTHAGLAHFRPDWTQDIARFLTGRDFISFMLQLRMRPELHALFDEEKIAQLAKAAEPISIMTVRHLFSAESYAARERRIWRVLEELIV